MFKSLPGQHVISIRGTFQHLPGISEKREAELWANGLQDWRDLLLATPEQFDLYRKNPKSIEAEIQRSEEALLAEDISFFADRLPKRELHRIATAFPDKCIFLDIETTGLSRHYDIVTLVGWSVGGEYFGEVAPKTISKLIRTLDENPIMVTFNGSLFDLPFLGKHYGFDWSKYLHVDLRYLAKRVDLTGGQKKIESEINLRREGSLREVDGAEAVTLWFDYKEGDMEALNRLIHYNHADVEGMKRIFEEAVTRLNSQSTQAPELFSRSQVIFNQFSQSKRPSPGVQVKPYSGNVGPRLVLTDLVKHQSKVGDARIVGIDLTGSEKRASGWSVVCGNAAEFALIATDDELIEATLNAKPNLVSIDSPLSLPLGRLSEFDDDPGRDKYGIVRVAERKLRERGINSYPALLPSMQKLTKRGIDLARTLRQSGIPVIESYPGAAQDILGIPRKQKGLTYLRRGLNRFGYSALKECTDVSHDELDALTSALVGQFMLAGFWEGVGSDEEDYMIVPTVDANAELENVELVVGISGGLGSGKTTAARLLEEKGFYYCRFSHILEADLKQQNKAISRTTLQAIGDEVRNSRFGQRKLHLAIAAGAKHAKRIVIDGLRHPEDHAFLTERWGYKSVHLHIEANTPDRRGRLIERNRTGDADFREIEQHEVEKNILLLRELASQVVMNDGSIQQYEKRIASILESLNAN